MPTYDGLLESAIKAAIPASAPASDPIQYYGQVGDFFGGVWGTLIGVVTLIVVFATWSSTRRIDSRSKIYQVFAEILRTHEEIVTSLRLGSLHGREAFSVMLSEFYSAYAALQKLEAEDGIALSLNRRVNASFLLMYYGVHPETVALLAAASPSIDGQKLFDQLSRRKRSANKKKIFSELGELFDGDPAERALWQQSINDAFEAVTSLEMLPEQRKLLREILTRAQTRPHNHVNRHQVVRFIEGHAESTEFGGHQNRLSHYFRNLHSAFSFIDEQQLTSREKHSLSKVLRSKLSNYEQALLALNSLADQGSSWITSGLIAKYMPIKNIPEHFFSFDKEFELKKQFPQVKFEWEQSPTTN